MKKKVLTILLAVTMSAVIGSPASAAEFTSGAESMTEFSENISNGEDALENNEDVAVLPETTEETKPAETAEQPDAEPGNIGEPAESENTESESTEDALEFSAEEITEDSVPEFEDGQENGFTENAEAPSASVKYPYMKRSGDVYTATIKKTTDKSYVKFVPNKTGKYVVKKTTTSSYGYTYTYGVYLAYDSKFKMLNEISNEMQGYSCYKLEKGKTYYFGCGEPCSKAVFQAEILADIVSIKPVEIDKSVVFYTPIDFYQQYFGMDNKNKYDVEEHWRGKIKITYSNGKTETISTADRNKYGQWLSRYIIYKGKKSSPEPGTYNVHLKFDGSKAETVIKNVKVKKISEMPTLNGSGQKTVKTGSNGMYVRFKTGKSTKYQVSVSFQNYSLGTQPIIIKQEKKGNLESVSSVFNGKTCTLKANTVYYFNVNLHSAWAESSTATIKVTPKN